MAAAGAPVHATGLAITFSSSFLGKITRVTWDGVTRGAINVTDSSDTVMTYIASKLRENGSIGVEGYFDKDTDPPIDSAEETITLSYDTETGELSAATLAGTGFMTDFSADMPLTDDTAATFSATLKFSSTITVTSAT